MRNNGPGDTQHTPAIDQVEVAKMRQFLRDIHEKTGSWRLVGKVIGHSGAYARMIANGEREPNQDAIDNWRMYVKFSVKTPRKRRRYWRPCLPLWLRDEIEKEGWSNKRITDELFVTLLVERTEKER